MKLLEDGLHGNTVTFVKVNLLNTNTLPFYSSRVSAGFPSPADDYLEFSISIGEVISSDPVSTFFVQVNGDSMNGAYIPDKALLAVDKSLKAKHNDIIVCCIDGEFTVKRLIEKNGQVWLKPENPKYKPLQITCEMDFRVWGVVVRVVHNPKDV